MSSFVKLDVKGYKLPFNGTWFVAQAGDTINVNHHMSEPSQFFGIDFIKINNLESRMLHQESGDKLSDFYAFGATVSSPASGTVVHVHNGEEDNSIGQSDKNNPAGNYIMIRANENEYILLAHFQKNTITVKMGQEIEIGELLGKCGNSGNSSCPHIHMHVQDNPILGKGCGKNIEFNNINVLLSGKHFSGVNWPLISGLFVNNAHNS